MGFINRTYNKFKGIIHYLSFSVLSTVLDTVVVWILFDNIGLPLGLSNTVGVVMGFILDFFLSVRFVFKTKYGTLSFLIYFATFLFGLAAANFLITESYGILTGLMSDGWSFLISKGISIVLPFFILYFLRKYLYSLLNRRFKGDE